MGGQKLPCQIGSRAASAHDHDLFHFLGGNAEQPDQFGQFRRRRHDAQLVLCQQHKAAGGDVNLAAALYGADQHPAVEHFADLVDPPAHKHMVSRQFNLHQLGPAAGK